MTNAWRPLTGKVALVTGAGRGLGYGIARALGRAGASVCVTDIQLDELAQAAAATASDGTPTIALELDVSDQAAFQRTVAAVTARWGRIDTLVHAAILMPLICFADTADDLWWRQIDVGLGGLYNGVRAVWPQLVAQGGGHIIGVASGSSVRGYTDEVAYCTAKHAQEGFMKALALEAAPLGIALNSIGPGAPVKPTGITWAELERMSPEEQAAWADPVELGQAFAWLAAQPPARFSGLRFDAGPIVRAIAAEGPEFAVEPAKVTLYVDDFVARQQWMAAYPSP